MINFFKKPFRAAILASLIIITFTSYVLLDTFVIPKAVTIQEQISPNLLAANQNTAAQNTAGTESSETSETPSTSTPIITETSYSDENIQITLETKQMYNTIYYVADIQISDASYLKTALAQATYGRNIKETTSAMATENNAILAINGDYYGFRDTGYVIRNGVLYRDTPSTGTTDDALVIDENGNFSIPHETEITAQELLDQGAWQVLSFGPSLIENSQIMVDENTEVDQSQNSNPRTAIGQISELHYVMVVSDGRTTESTGLTLYQLAGILKDIGCTTAYNLDGGGSSTMVFNGKVVNQTTSGKNNSERSVSDIVYIG